MFNLDNLINLGLSRISILLKSEFQEFFRITVFSFQL